MSGSRAIGAYSVVPAVAPPAASASLSVAATTLAVGPVDLDRDGEYDITIYAVNATGSQALLSLFINADTAPTNYWRQAHGFNNTTVTGGRANDAFIGVIHASGHTILHYKLVKRNGRVFLTGMGHEGFGSTIELRTNIQQWQTLNTNPVTLTLSSSVASALGINTQIQVNFRPNYTVAIPRGSVFNLEHLTDTGARTITAGYTYGLSTPVPRNVLAEYTQLAIPYTPQYGNSLLRYRMNISHWVSTAQNTYVFHLYKDADTTPLNEWWEVADGNEHNAVGTFEWIMPAESTTARTYRFFLAANNGAALYINRTPVYPTFHGNRAYSQVSVEEIKR
jgi:hypothetical protein